MPTHENGVPEQLPPEPKTGGAEDQGSSIPEPELPRWATKSKIASTFSEDRMAAYIGPRWESTYRRKLTGFFADPAFTVSWNWAAFVVGPLWFLYRKLYLAFSLFFLASQSLYSYLLMGFDPAQLGAGLTNPANRPALITVVGLTFAIHLASAGTANWLLYRRARFKSLIVTLQQVPEDVAVSRLQRLGGVNVAPIVLLVLLQLAFAVVAVLAPAA
ncbi:MAG: DUF2628 domain-containing protein [Phycisphaerae bacterium]|nr:DUF2628 domain-containing protein [Gemmatimonadaceae bacterium]